MLSERVFTVKSFLRTPLIFCLVLALTGCTLPEVTPLPSPSTDSQPTSTAPVVPTAIPPTETSVSINEVITLQNAASLKTIARSANSNVQMMAWSLDSQSITLISQNSNDSGSQVFGAASLQVPTLNPGYVWAAPSGSRILGASPDGTTLAVLSNDSNTVALVNGTSGKTLQNITPGFLVEYGSFSPDGKTLALTAHEEWKVKLYLVESGEEKATLTGFDTAAPVFDAGFAGNNQWIVWHARGTLQVQNAETKTLGIAINQEDSVSAFTVSFDGALLASAAGKTLSGVFKPVVSIWNVESGAPIRDLLLENAATALSFSPDGKLLAVAEGNVIQIWDVANEAVITSLGDNPNPVYRLAFSPDGKMLASSGNDNELILWAVGK